jgi:hypothetical protein
MLKGLTLGFIFLLTLQTLSLADELKSITLKDGTIIKGMVTKFENGVYSIHSEKLGEITVKDDDVGIIQSDQFSQSATPLSAPAVAGSLVPSSDIRSQVQRMQGTLLSDPTIMQEIQQLVSDPEIQKLMSDQNFVADMLSMDQTKMQNSPKLQEMLTNPKVQRLMELIQAKFPTTTGSTP